MTSVTIFSGSFFLIQVVLLVLYYGGFVPLLPWWVVWFPTLVIGCIVGVVVVIVIVVLATMLLAGINDGRY
jgi:hypothetical protein